jgi:hypothetical protein
VVSLSTKPRTWTLYYTHAKFGPTREGHYTDKGAAVQAAQSRANDNQVPVRVSTKGHFGSLTVNPESR